MQATLERLRSRREEMEDEGGFTLIELLIVIVILGILAAIVVFAVQNLTTQSAAASCQAQYKTVETAAEAYKAQIGSYPTAATIFTAGSGLEATGVTGLDGSTTNGPWLRDEPPVSGSSSPYFIAWDATTGSVQVGTVLGNGAKSTTPAADGNGNCAQA
jgi:general secretion pathway protein G